MTSFNEEPLSFIHQPLLKEKFAHLHLHLSEYSFANLYLFRALHQYRVLRDEEEVFIKGITREGISFIMLTTPPQEVLLPILKQVLADGSVLFPVPDQWLSFLEKWMVQSSFLEADSDYLFTVQKLLNYPGRHLSKKRNLVKQLREMHHVKAETLSSQHLTDARSILDQWQEDHKESNETDFGACQEAIQLFQKLELHGRIVYVDDKPAGFIIGEWLTKECYGAHFCKGLKEIKGLYQYLYQDLAQAVEGSCQWINLEQDLGLPEIRVAKHSYLPDTLLRKWRMQLIIP